MLNLMMFPAGYAYVGAWRLAAVCVALLILTAVVLLSWTYAFPPGAYSADLQNLLPLTWGLGAALGAHAALLARRAAPRAGSRWKHAALYLAFPLVSLLAMLGIRMVSPISVYSVASGSMDPTLRRGDIVAVRGMRAACGGVRPQPGDVVVYRQPGEGSTAYMQRAVAGPGRTVGLTGGLLTIDGVVAGTVAPTSVKTQIRELGFTRPATIVRETLANGVRYSTLDFGPDGETDNIASRRLGPNQWFILGDSRDNAVDSRIVGPIAVENICGVAIRILQSEDESRVGAKP